MTLAWPDEIVDKLTAMVERGESAGQIGIALGRSRNAVLGKALRIGLKFKGDSSWNGHRLFEREADESTEDERTEIARLYLQVGMSEAMIAERVGRRSGSVRLILKRAGVLAKSGPDRNRQIAAARPKMDAHRASLIRKPPTPRQREIVVFDGDAVNLINLRGRMCRWPINDPPPGECHDMLFCGAPADGVYCPTHAALAVTPGKVQGVRLDSRWR